MRVRETFDAYQWYPDKPHEAVSTSVLESGMAGDLHQSLADQLRQGQGQIGVIRTADKWDPWHLVYPGDWIVTRGGRFELVKEHDFPKRFVAE